METNPLDEHDLRNRIQANLTDFVSTHRDFMSTISSDSLFLADTLDGLIDGGKRLRPAFAYWGYRATGAPDTDAVVAACTSLEFLQACALIHDDVMDGSDTRRGNPSVHKQFESLHLENQWSGSAESYGVGSAILVGDLALSWADEMLYASGLDASAVSRAKQEYDVMRTELMAGQYLDLLEQVRHEITPERASTVIKFKSAKYTIERPLLMGAAIADATPEIKQSLSNYGLALGEAFQLRDDVLGVFGDSATTGKPSGDDLREGKQTLLVAHARLLATDSEVAKLNESLGDPNLSADNIAELQSLLSNCGALEVVEQRISEQTELALTTLASASITAEAKSALTSLAIMATKRSA